MSIFDFPRINVKGLVQINVGTANNDDYALTAGPNPSTFGGYTAPPGVDNQGYSFRLASSAAVQPDPGLLPDRGNDGALADWMIHRQPVRKFNNGATGVAAQLIPGEWNYFGNMGMNMMETRVVGVLVRPGHVHVQDDASPGLAGATLSFNEGPGEKAGSKAMLIDVNPEAPPASQVFSDNLLLVGSGGATLFNGKPSKSSTRMINFQRNTFLNGPNGAGGTFQCVVPVAGQPIVQILKDLNPGDRRLENLTQLVFRYTLFRSLQKINYWNYGKNGQMTPEWFAKIEELYQTQGSNATFVQISGTIAPYYDGELQSMPTGRYLAPSSSQFFLSPGGNTAPGGGPFSLAPAIVQNGVDAGEPYISIDLSATLPDQYVPDADFDPLNTSNNDKFNLGPLQLGWRQGPQFQSIGLVPYLERVEVGGVKVQRGDLQGWIFDFPVEKIPAESYLVLSGTNTQGLAGDLLVEQPTWFVSDQPGVYAEQGLQPTTEGWQKMPALPMSTKTVSSQGYQDSQLSFGAFTRGVPDKSGSYEIWISNQTYVDPRYSSSPPPVKIVDAYTPGDSIAVPTGVAGTFIVTIAPHGSTAAQVVQALNNLATAPMINIRILPNIEYADLFTFDADGKPAATPAMNFQALYQRVFRNYFLLYPAMNEVIALNDPQMWVGAGLHHLLDRVDTKSWPSFKNMPRTRDLSATRRWLIQAYCHKFLKAKFPANLGSG
jgi:hypothetical protein